MPTPIALQPAIRFASGPISAPKSLTDQRDEEIVTLLIRELPSESGLSPTLLENAYTVVTGYPQNLHNLFLDHSSPTTEAIFKAILYKYIIPQYQPHLRAAHLLLHPLLAELSADPTKKYQDKPQAKTRFPIYFEVIDMPDKARAARLLRLAFNETLNASIVERFITECLPKRQNP